MASLSVAYDRPTAAPARRPEDTVNPQTAVASQVPQTARLQDRVAIVTGAASGIGAATARRLAHEGARVALFDIDGNRGTAVAEQARAGGGDVVFIEGDVSVEENARAAVAQVEETWGKLDILVSNAGNAPPDIAVEDLDFETWNDILAELNGSFFFSKHAVRLMKKQPPTDKRAIVYVASTAGLKGVPLRQAYCAMKHGIVGLSDALALELAPDRIRVNCVAPGPVDTALTRRGLGERADDRIATMAQNVPLGRIGMPDDIANMIFHLVSDESTWATGMVLRMAGGKD
jgi:NAD(P)-dependent dehydrogenase (short-subunit alcohol dehydrogenase family)